MNTFKKALVVIALLGLGCSLFRVFSGPRAASIKIIDRRGRVKASFKVEVADSGEERKRGLMFRDNLPLDRGMIFVFPREEDHFFWMKNTLIPLDIIFINRMGEIVGLVENALPESEELLGVAQKSLYVLEINGGLAEKYDITVKDKVKGLESLPKGG